MDLIKLDASTIRTFEHLMFRWQRPFLDQWVDSGNLVAYGGLEFFGAPFALGLAIRSSDGRSGWIQSIFVSSEFRNQGIGSALLERLGADLHAHGCRNLTALYRAGQSSTRIFEHMLCKRNWDDPMPHSCVCYLTRNGYLRILKSPWMQRNVLGATMRIVPWHEIGDDALADLRRRQEQHPFVDDSVWPSSDNLNNLDPSTSLALLKGDELIGWMLNKRLSPGLLYYTALFADARYRNRGVGLQLLAESIHRHYALEGHLPTLSAIWEFYGDNLAMMRVNRRRLAPFVDTFTENRKATKTIG